MRVEPPAPGFSRADLHVHTTFSDGTASPEDVLNFYALHSGVRVFAITDHDTLDGALHARRFRREHEDLFGHLEIIVGEEVSSRDGHVLGLFLEEWVPPGMDARETVEAIHRQGGIAIAAHPYTNLMRWSGLVGVGDLVREIPFDAVETRNSNFTEFLCNAKAERNAGGKARVGNSDGHFLEAVGRCYTDFPGVTAEDLRRALLERTTIAGGRCYGLPTLLRFVLGRLRAGLSFWPHRQDFRRCAEDGDMEIRVHEDSSFEVAVLTVVGRLDRLGMPTLKETLLRLTEARAGIVLDLSEVSILDSAGISALVAGARGARTHGVGFCLTGVSKACDRSLDAAGLRRVFARARNTHEARALVARQRPRDDAPLAPAA